MKKLSVTLLLLSFILVACGGNQTLEPTSDNASAVSQEVAEQAPTNVPAPTEAAMVEETVEEAVEESDDDSSEMDTSEDSEDSMEEIAQTTGFLHEDKVIIGDDRPSGLKSLTRQWNTDWTRHTIDYSDILSGGPPRDGIPSIDEPQFISQAEADEWVQDQEPVVAIEINGDARAYPLQVLTWHEIVNDTVGEIPVVVTFCPLCNSALTFVRTIDGEPVEFGVSGLLRNSDLIMYDRTTESLWQQFTGEGVVGERAGDQLEFVGTLLISYGDFKEAYSDGVVLSKDTGFGRAYGTNPYVGYDTIGSDPFLFDGVIDGSLPAVARVVTIHLQEQNLDIAYSVADLTEVGVINDTQGDQPLVVMHKPGATSALGARNIADAEDVGATSVFDPTVDGKVLTFRKNGEQIIDEQTQSVWNIVGRATEGKLAGTQLDRIVSADHFWFSWAAFRPDTILYAP